MTTTQEVSHNGFLASLSAVAIFPVMVIIHLALILCFKIDSENGRIVAKANEDVCKLAGNSLRFAVFIRPT